MMLEETFVALDFETASSAADSACALALVTAVGGRIVSKQHWLIRPPDPLFLFTYIHGITWDMVKDKPTFKDIWPQVEATLNEADFLVAHNASFDKRVLEACCRTAGVPLKERRFVCTVQVARKTWQLKPAKLNNCCDFLGIELKHHEALSDAEACARILLAAQKSGRLQEA